MFRMRNDITNEMLSKDELAIVRECANEAYGDFNEKLTFITDSFIKGEIDEHTFAKACEIIKKQEETKCDIRCLGILDEWAHKLGLK